MTERDKKYIDKRRFQSAGGESLILELINSFYIHLLKKSENSAQVDTLESLSTQVAKEHVKEKEIDFLADTIYKYALGSGYLRVEKRRVTLTNKSKKYLNI